MLLVLSLEPNLKVQLEFGINIVLKLLKSNNSDYTPFILFIEKLALCGREVPQFYHNPSTQIPVASLPLVWFVQGKGALNFILVDSMWIAIPLPCCFQ